jgi:hypothetical protein
MQNPSGPYHVAAMPQIQDSPPRFLESTQGQGAGRRTVAVCNSDLPGRPVRQTDRLVARSAASDDKARLI